MFRVLVQGILINNYFSNLLSIISNLIQINIVGRANCAPFLCQIFLFNII